MRNSINQKFTLDAGIPPNSGIHSKASVTREDRKFGMVLTLVLAFLSGLFCWRNHQGVSIGFLSAGILSLVFTLVYPAGMKYPQKVLRAIGWFNSQLILVLVYYLVFTPVGLLMRLFRRVPLDINWRKKRESYWISREQVPFDPERLERQY